MVAGLERFLSVLACLMIVFAGPPAHALSQQLTYDANGNVVQGVSEFYEYNSLNQLWRVYENNSSGSVLVEYTYDYNGARIKKTVFNQTDNITTYFPDDNFERTVSSSGTKDVIYYSDDGLLLGKEDERGTRFFYHPDVLGSTDVVTNQARGVVEDWSYEPFGLSLVSGESRNSFTGQQDDRETSLMYYNARYYSPFLRRFTQPDTMLPDVYDAQQLNRYAYARNNPLKYTDPSGHCVLACVGDAAVGTYFLYLAGAAVISMVIGLTFINYENQDEYDTPVIDVPSPFVPVSLPGVSNGNNFPLQTPSSNPFEVPLKTPSIESLPIHVPGTQNYFNQPLQTKGKVEEDFTRLPRNENKNFNDNVPRFFYQDVKRFNQIREIYDQNGFRDASGNTWKWHQKSNHYDVTNSKGNHINVNSDGTITHGKIPLEWEPFIK